MLQIMRVLHTIYWQFDPKRSKERRVFAEINLMSGVIG
jgi:hypothetical protein